MGLFGAAHGCGGGASPPPAPPPLVKSSYIYPTIMKLATVIPYLKNIPKIYKSRETSLEFSWHQHFFTENQQILLYQEIQI